MNITPRDVQTWGLRTFAFSAPGALTIMLAWGLHWLPPQRPYLALMLYLMLLVTGGCGALAAAGASCHMAIARAFAAGLNAGHAQHRQLEREAARPALRLVE